MSRIERSVVAYAFLAQARRSGDDLLSGLMPIFKPIAKLKEGERFDAKEFASLAGELYGLSVSPWAVESLAPRLEATGILARIPLTEGAHDYIYAQINDDFSEVTATDVSYVLDKFTTFAKPLISEKGLEHQDDESLKESFLQHIVDLDFVGILLKPTRPNDNEGRTKLSLPKSEEQRDWEDDKLKRAKIDVLCASFIVDIYKQDRPLYDLVARITAGALLSEVILNFQNPEADVPLTQLRVVLDAPFLMDVLDLAGQEAGRVASEVCDQLRKNGARLAVFQHSVDEMKENLAAVESAVEVGEGHGPTARRLADPRFRAYASAIRQSPQARLEKEKISIIDTPLGPRAFQWFTEEDEEKFCRSLGYYQNRKAQYRDAASIAGVMRLREGRRARMGKFQTCRTLFVTSNPWVAKRSKEALQRARIYEESDVPPALTDRYLAGLLWVLYGGTAGELPAQVLLANCAAAIEPKTDLIKRMHKFLAGVDEKQAEYFQALMTEERAAQYLSQLSLGDSSYITQDNATIILENMQQALIEKQEAERAAERKKYEQKIEQQAEEFDRQRSQIEEDRRQAEAEVMRARAETESVRTDVQRLEEQMLRDRKKREEHDRNAVKSGVERARFWYGVAHWVVAFLIAFSAFGAALLANQASNPYLRWAGLIGSAIVVALGFWKIPDMVLGRWMTKFRDQVLKRFLTSRGIGTEPLNQLSIDWNSGSVKQVDMTKNAERPSNAESTIQ